MGEPLPSSQPATNLALSLLPQIGWGEGNLKHFFFSSAAQEHVIFIGTIVAPIVIIIIL